MHLDGAAFDKHRLEGLNAQTVQRRRTIEQHGPLLDHLFEDVPDLGPSPLGHPLGALYVVGEPLHHQPVHDERLEELQGHPPWQPTLMKLQVRPRDDHGAAAVVDPLSEQVLPEPALLAPEQIGQRLEPVVVAASHRAAPAPVVHESVNGLLQHPLFVAYDYLGGLELNEPLQPVVAVDDTTVQVVEVARGETTAVKLDHGPELRGQHG